MFPIESVLLILFLQLVIPPMTHARQLPRGMNKLTFTRKNIAVLAVLTLVGVAAVVLYTMKR